MISDETPVERRLRDVEKRMRRIFDAELEADAIDCGRDAIRLVVDADKSSFNEWVARRNALLARCTEGPR